MRHYLLLIACCLALGGTVGCGSPDSSTQAATEEVAEKAKPALPANDYHSRRFLLEVEDVQRMMNEGVDLVIIEITKEEEYAKGHLPGARHVWRPEYANTSDFTYGGMMGTPEQLEALLGRLGATNESFLLLYDAKGKVDAARLQWILHEYGYYRTGLLNGGKQGWVAAGQALTTDIPEVIATEFVFPAESKPAARKVHMEDVLLALEDSNVVLVDTRTTEEYTGQMLKNGAAKAGRIPGAIHLDWANAVNYDADFRFKSVEQLRKMYEAAGITPDKKIIAYCHSGVRSAHTTYVLTELLGYPEVYNYDGSWTEWSHHDHLPFEVDPSLNRTPALN